MVLKKIVKLTIFLVLISLFFLYHSSSAIEDTTVAGILQNKDQFDGKELVVSGKVTKLKLKTSKAGKDYTTFSLKC